MPTNCILDKNGRPNHAAPRILRLGEEQQQVGINLPGIAPQGVGFVVIVDNKPLTMMLPADLAREIGCKLIGFAHQWELAQGQDKGG